MTEDSSFKIEKRMRNSSVGKLIGNLIDKEKWSIKKIIILVIILLLPFGLLLVGLYFAAKAYKQGEKK